MILLDVRSSRLVTLHLESIYKHETQVLLTAQLADRLPEQSEFSNS